ncbi:MAG: Tm-1-like ATP-binding domain-containing protein [Endomicrobium sp.]|jgi:uncharacterized protein (UPF0261 family)|nr:Tm-1-like ATP-binding domain-containing protein [Endomicrobium sp.]
MGKVYIAGTCDTKYPELRYIKELIVKAGLEAVLADVGSYKHENPVDVKNTDIAKYNEKNPDFLNDIKDRGKTVIAMSEAFEKWIAAQKDVAGIISAGGSGNTSLVTRGMRALDIGIPKVMVSTVASSDVSPYVGASDICMMYSVADIASLNSITRTVLANAANAVIGMVKYKTGIPKDTLPLLGMTMFGVTTPAVMQISGIMKEKFEPLIFHAVGSGGKSLEKLIDSGLVKNVIDVTTTEICDELMGGVFSAGPDRLGAMIRTGIPYVGSAGALDMVNFNAVETVPEKYKNRKLHIHNSNVTLMRTTPEENTLLGKWIAGKLNLMKGEVRFLLPLKGVSMLDAEGMPFYDPEADKALFDTLEKYVNQNDKRKLVKLDMHINDEAFSKALADAFYEIHNK